MNEIKNERLLRLYEVIGNIDAATATDVLSYKHKFSFKSIRLFIVLTACVCLLASMFAVGSFLMAGSKSEDNRFPSDVNNSIKDDENAEEGALITTVPPDALDTTPTGDTVAVTLDDIFEKNKAHSVRVNFDSIKDVLSSGKLSLIWEKNGEYYIKEIDKAEDATLLKKFITEQKYGVEIDAFIPKYNFWIAFEDGTVMTPYLEYSEESISNGSLFDYSPEIYPTSEFVIFIEKILKN